MSYLSLIPFVAPVTTNTAATTHGLSTAAVTSDEDITTPTGESITAVEHTGGSSGEGRVKSLWDTVYLIKFIWVRSRNCGCLVTWFCYQLIAKPGNKTAAVPWPDPYAVCFVLVFCAHKLLGLGGFISCLYPACSRLLQWHWGNRMIASVPVK